jgi:hypothetical protein
MKTGGKELWISGMLLEIHEFQVVFTVFTAVWNGSHGFGP